MNLQEKIENKLKDLLIEIGKSNNPLGLIFDYSCEIRTEIIKEIALELSEERKEMEELVKRLSKGV